MNPAQHAKVLAKRLLARSGYQLYHLPGVESLQDHLMRVFSRLAINCVVDVGAYRGSYALELRNAGYTGHILSFEPVAQNFAALAKAAGGDASWRTFPFALGDRAGDATINLYEGTTFHSLLKPSDFGRDAFPDKLAVTGTETITIRRLADVLDDCLRGIPEPRIFLKMDTQGYDLSVVEGAEAILHRVLGLQSEMAVTPIYRDMTTTMSNAVPELQKRGFGLTGLFPVTYDRRDQLSIIELDCVMIRPPAWESSAAAGAGNSNRA